MGAKAGSIIEISGYRKALFNFSEDSVGDEGVDISFVDLDVTGENAKADIIAAWQNHKKLIRINGRILETPYIGHTIPTATSGTIEFLWGCNDVTKVHIAGLIDGLSYIILLYIKDSKFQYLNSSWQYVVLLDPIVNNTLYHIKFVWRTDNTFDIYVDRVKKVDNKATTQNQDDGVDSFMLQNSTGGAGDYVYLNAYGNVANADYAEGDNLTFETGKKDGSIAELNKKDGSIAEI